MCDHRHNVGIHITLIQNVLDYLHDNCTFNVHCNSNYCKLTKIQVTRCEPVGCSDNKPMQIIIDEVALFNYKI